MSGLLKSSCVEGRKTVTGAHILGAEEAKSSREMSIAASFVFPTIQFTPVHLHLRDFHSNGRGAIRSIFDIGTWLWRRSCDLSLNRPHGGKKKEEGEGGASLPDFRLPLLLLQWLPSSRNLSSQRQFFFSFLCAAHSETGKWGCISLSWKCYRCTVCRLMNSYWRDICGEKEKKIV